MPSDPPIPRAVLVFGLLGLLPFLLPLIGLWQPDMAPVLGSIALLYAALILSFLGGARWGMAIVPATPAAITISLAMLPTLAALGVLILFHGLVFWQLLAMAGLLIVQLAWDLLGASLPGWYPRLRILLTSGAVLGLVAGALSLPR